jgi:hypothetical protein
VADVENVVRVDQERSLGQQITTLSADFLGNQAYVNSQLISISSSQQALAGRLDTFEVSVDDEFAEVRQEVSAVYDPNTGAVAQAVTTVNVNGVRGVVGIQVAGGQAQIIGIANQFAILNPINGQLVTAFVVSDGRVIMPEAFIDALTISKLRSSTGSLVFQDDRLQAAYIAVEQLEVQWAQIKNVSIGTADIQNAAINTAKIANGAITTAKIQDLAVDTLKIGNDAVTVPVSTFTAGGITVSAQSGWRVAASLFIPGNNTGSPVNILATATFSIGWRFSSTTGRSMLDVFLYDASEGVRLGALSRVDMSDFVSEYYSSGTISLSFRLPNNWNGKTVQLIAEQESGTPGTSGGSYTIVNRSIQALTVKR